MKSIFALLLLCLSAAAPVLAQGVPVLDEIVPNSALAGSPAVTITATGGGFTSSSLIQVNGEVLPTTFVSSTTLRTTIPDTRLTTVGALSVRVANSSSSVSQSAVFSVYSSVPPSVSSISPAAGLRGTTMTVTLTGTNLISASLGFSGAGIRAVPLNGTPTSLPVQISVAADAPLGVQNVTVSTPAGSTTTCGRRPCTFAIVDSGAWTRTGLFHDFRTSGTIVRLLDGRVLIAGGGSGNNETSSAEIFDPNTGDWTPIQPMNLARRNAAACLLPDGRVLVAGGQNGYSSLSSAEIYDPATGTWTVAGFMAGQNARPMLLLPGGQVLVPHFPAPDEIFDPVDGRFHPAPSGSAFMESSAYSLLADGRILIVKITGDQGAVRIYDPSTATFSDGPSVSWFNVGAAARLLPDSRVLIRTINQRLANVGHTFDFNSTFLYSVPTNSAGPGTPLTRGSDVLLPSGLVLINGSFGAENYEAPILYDPSTDQIIPAPAMSRQFVTASAVLLDDGRVVVIGVNGGSGQTPDSAEIYTPAASNNPVPFVSSAASGNAASDADFITLDIRGDSFLPNSIVRIDSTRLVTLYLGARRLVAFVPPSLRSGLSSSGVTVTNPGPGGGTTAPIRAGFIAPPPAITSVSPNAASPGTQFTAMVSGQNLGGTTSISFGGNGVSAAIQPGGSATSLVLSVQVAPDAGIGMRSLTVTTAAGSATLATALRIQRATVPATLPLPITEVETGAIRSGYVVITPAAGTVSPVSTLTYGIVRDGAVQSHGSLLPTPLTTETSLLVDVVQTISRNLGIAVANVSGTAASIVLTLRDEDGMPVGAPVSLSIPGRQQVARFVTELFPSSTIGNAFRGNVTIQSSIPVSIVGIHFSGIEFGTVPVPVTGAPLFATTTVVFPQFAMSGEWATTLGLLNTSSNAISGRVEVFDTSGNPMAVTLNGTTASSFQYALPAFGSLTLAPRDSNGQSPF